MEDVEESSVASSIQGKKTTKVDKKLLPNMMLPRLGSQILSLTKEMDPSLILTQLLSMAKMQNHL
jgi:hypothetical protein